jgi:MerR family mercuric resistance operon transcriptional regulator
MKLTIGKLAQQSNVTVETIRHYQRKKLVREPEKPANGFREYPVETIEIIRFIKHAQQSGFSLKEISELLLLNDSHCSDVRKIAEQKLQKIDEQINNLITFRNILGDLVQGCYSHPTAQRCSLIKAIFEKSNNKKYF